MDSDISSYAKHSRSGSIAAYRPDLGTAASMDRAAAETQQGIEHSCRVLNESPEACAKAIEGISEACKQCVAHFLARR